MTARMCCCVVAATGSVAGRDGRRAPDQAGAASPRRNPPAPAAPAPAAPTPGAGPVIVVETVKGTFEFETYPNEAPRTVEHVVNLVKKNFYNGLRFHRVEPGFVIQAGDPQHARLHEEGPLGHRWQRHAGRRRPSSRASTST